MKIRAVEKILVLFLIQSLLLICCHKEEEKYAQTLVRTLDAGKVMSTKNAIDKIAFSLNRYMMDTGKYAEGEGFSAIEAVLVPMYANELRVKDAWGNEMHYTSDGQKFTLSSAGEDRIFDTSDDIVMVNGEYR